jgi:hypothetical protein
MVGQGKVVTIIIARKDRLVRFGFEMTKDLLSIIHFFLECWDFDFSIHEVTWELIGQDPGGLFRAEPAPGSIRGLQIPDYYARQTA